MARAKKSSPISDSIKVEEVRVKLTGEPSAILLNKLIQEDGDTAYFDSKFAECFVKLAGCPLSDAMYAVRTLAKTITHKGPNAYGRSMQAACAQILDWWWRGDEFSLNDLLQFVGDRLENGVVIWAVLLKQVGYGPVKIERL